MCLYVTDASAHSIPFRTGWISFTLVLDLCLRPYVATVVVHLRNSPIFLSASSLCCTAVTSEVLYVLTPFSVLSGTHRCLM